MAAIVIILISAISAIANAGNASQMAKCDASKKAKCTEEVDPDATVVSLLQVQTLEGSAAMVAAVAEVRAAVAATNRLRRRYGDIVAQDTWHSALDQVTSAITQVRAHEQDAPVGTGPLPVGPLPPINVLKANPQTSISQQASMQQQKPTAQPAAATTAPPATEGGKEAAGDIPQGARIAPFGKEDTAAELTKHAARTQDTLVDAVENAEVAEVKRAVFRALTRLRAASIKEFDTIARLETQAIDEYNDAHHYRAENPLSYIHTTESEVKEDKYTSFH